MPVRVPVPATGRGPAVSDHPTSDGRLRVTYRLTLEEGEQARMRALGIALEQTVGMPAAYLPRGLEEKVVGRVEEVEEIGERRVRAVVSYAPEVVGEDLAQLLDLLFGNISLQAGIRVVAVDWPPAILGRFPGPALGIAGLRERAEVRERRPLLCAPLRPLGSGAGALAELARGFAAAHVDLVKDDHSLANQPSAPFRQRVEACLEAVAGANRRTGGRTLYLPNLTGGPQDLARRVAWLREVGCPGVLVSPALLGWANVSWLARSSGLAILGHPSWTGSLFARDHGLAPELVLGDLFRFLGCDGVVYPNVGGRSRFDLRTCEAINRALRRPRGRIRPAFPVPGGGIDRSRVPLWIERYGPDTVFLLGSSLYAAPDPFEAAREVGVAMRGAGR